MRRASRLVNWPNLYRLFGKFSIEPSRKQVSANISTDLRGIERGSIFEDIDKYRACDVWTNSDRTLFRKNRWLKIRNRTNILPGDAKCEAFLKSICTSYPGKFWKFCKEWFPFFSKKLGRRVGVCSKKGIKKIVSITRQGSKLLHAHRNVKLYQQTGIRSSFGADSQQNETIFIRSAHWLKKRSTSKNGEETRYFNQKSILRPRKWSCTVTRRLSCCSLVGFRIQHGEVDLWAILQKK